MFKFSFAYSQTIHILYSDKVFMNLLILAFVIELPAVSFTYMQNIFYIKTGTCNLLKFLWYIVLYSVHTRCCINAYGMIVLSKFQPQTLHKKLFIDNRSLINLDYFTHDETYRMC